MTPLGRNYGSEKRGEIPASALRLQKHEHPTKARIGQRTSIQVRRLSSSPELGFSES